MARDRFAPEPNSDVHSSADVRLSLTGLVVALAAFGLSSLWFSRGVGAQLVDERIQLPDPVASLAEARAAAPYPIRLPDLPAGTTTVIVQWALPDEEQSGDLVSVDIWYQLPTGEMVHVWQSNIAALLEADEDPTGPMRGGSEIDLANGRWTRRVVDNFPAPRVELARLFPKDVVLTIDSPVELEPSLRSLAEGF